MLIQKDPRKGTLSSNYRPNTGLFMWKILNAQIKEEIPYSLIFIV